MPNNSVTKNDVLPIRDELIRSYKKLESQLNIINIGSEVSYISPVNFNEAMASPRHRWFPYKEGFSPSFVKQFISNNIAPPSKGIVLDPFSGVGTTTLVASQLGYKSIGLDVSPLSTFVAKTKSTMLNVQEQKYFEDTINNFSSSKMNSIYPPPENETVLKYYEPAYLDALLRVRSFIESIDCTSIRNLFFLAYLASLEDFSTHRKAGNGVKKKTRINYLNKQRSPLENVKTSIIKLLEIYKIDLISNKLKNKTFYKNCSCLDEESYDEIDSIAGVFTSPPYANCFDYSKIYMRELWLGDFFKSKCDQKKFRESSLRSHVHATWEDRHPEYSETITDSLIKPILDQQKLWSNKISSMLSGYFKDLSRVIDLIGKKSESGTRAGFVVSNSFYGGIPVATDILISSCAEKLGYKTVSIEVYRGMIPSSQQYKKIEEKNFMRESLVTLEKI